jgi:hypothetical protein
VRGVRAARQVVGFRGAALAVREPSQHTLRRLWCWLPEERTAAMSVADQIGFGACMALIPYLFWSVGAEVFGRYGSGPPPVFLGHRLAQLRFHAVLGESKEKR